MRIAVVVNESARRGNGEVAAEARRELPLSRVFLSRSLDELERFAVELIEDPPDLVLSAGGDGTAIALLNALKRADARVRGARHRNASSDGPIADARPRASRHRLGPPVGLLKLGTGNGWSRLMGAPPFKQAIALLRAASMRRDFGRALSSSLLSTFDLVDVEGQLAHFTGTGWDAEIILDFHGQKAGPGILPPSRRHGLLGYVNGLLTRTVPRNLRLPQAEVKITNTGAEAVGIDSLGRAVRMPGAHAGHVLFEGGSSVCGVGTEPMWGFGFKAFPFAGLVEGRFNLRNYGAKALEGLMNTPSLWKGKHPIDKMDTWLLTRARLDFSRKVAFQIGGDLLGERDSIEYVIAHEFVELLDWSKLAARLREPEREPAREVGRRHHVRA